MRIVMLFARGFAAARKRNQGVGKPAALVRR